MNGESEGSETIRVTLALNTIFTLETLLDYHKQSICLKLLLFYPQSFCLGVLADMDNQSAGTVRRTPKLVFETGGVEVLD